MTNPSELNAFFRNLQTQDEEIPAASDESEQLPLVVDRDQARRERTRKIGLFTTSFCEIPGWRVVRTHPMITARRVLGINAWQDFKIAIRDMVGGRSQTAEAAFERMETELLQDLQMKAAATGCHAVIGVNVQFGEISGGDKAQLFYAAAQGTPVLMEPVSPSQNTK